MLMAVFKTSLMTHHKKLVVTWHINKILIVEFMRMRKFLMLVSYYRVEIQVNLYKDVPLSKYWKLFTYRCVITRNYTYLNEISHKSNKYNV